MDGGISTIFIKRLNRSSGFWDYLRLLLALSEPQDSACKFKQEAAFPLNAEKVMNIVGSQNSAIPNNPISVSEKRIFKFNIPDYIVKLSLDTMVLSTMLGIVNKGFSTEIPMFFTSTILLCKDLELNPARLNGKINWKNVAKISLSASLWLVLNMYHKQVVDITHHKINELMFGHTAS